MLVTQFAQGERWEGIRSPLGVNLDFKTRAETAKILDRKRLIYSKQKSSHSFSVDSSLHIGKRMKSSCRADCVVLSNSFENQLRVTDNVLRVVV